MYKTTNRARPEQDTRPTHNPARVADGLPFCYNVQHVKSAKAPIADCFSSGRLVNFTRESALRGDVYYVPSYAFPFGHTSRLDRTCTRHRLFVPLRTACKVTRGRDKQEMAIMNAEDIKNKAAETMSNAKEKVEAIASDKRVQSAKVSILKFISDAKFWVVSNWNVPGWHGKAKVAAAIIVAFFFCRGVFCGWGTSQNTISASSTASSNSSADDADAAALLMLLGAARGGDGGSTQSSAPRQSSISIWTCTKCGRQIQSKFKPSSSIQCPTWSGRNDGTKYCNFALSN